MNPILNLQISPDKSIESVPVLKFKIAIGCVKIRLFSDIPYEIVQFAKKEVIK